MIMWYIEFRVQIMQNQVEKNMELADPCTLNFKQWQWLPWNIEKFAD